jgi:hypothetical protein
VRPCTKRKRLRDAYADAVFHYSEVVRQENGDESEASARMAVSIALDAYESHIKGHRCSNGQKTKIMRGQSKIGSRHEEQEMDATASVRYRLGEPGASAAE